MSGGEQMPQAGSATPVSWLRAVRIEFALVGRTRRRFLLGSLALVLAAGLYAAVQAFLGNWNEPPGDIGRDLGAAFMATLLFTLIWSGEVWRDAPADARDWFWAQPIAQAKHELARLVAGLGWVALAALTLSALQLFAAVAYGQPVLLDRQTGPMWLDLLTGPLTVFLLGSIWGLRSAHPLRWILGLAFALMVLPDMFDHDHVLRVVRNTVFGAVADPFNHEFGYRLGWSAPASRVWLAVAALTLLLASTGVVLAARVRRPS